jgi:hypothetical protein
MNEPFWMVWCESQAVPVRKHSTEKEAITEAVRISGKEKRIAHVMKCIGQAIPQDPPVVWAPSV